MTRTTTPKASKPPATYTRETAFIVPAAEGRTRGVTFRLDGDRVYVSMSGQTIPLALDLFAGAAGELCREASVETVMREARVARATADQQSAV